MLCINCHHKDTQVTNSRPHRKEPHVWRRRHCPACGHDFTTQERPVLDTHLYVIHLQSGLKEPFYQGKLLYSIIRSFAYDEQFGIKNALPLSETVITELLPIKRLLSTQQIARACYNVLQRFDKVAAAQYALAHGITAAPKRRRKKA